jgi:hypothetical protein
MAKRGKRLVFHGAYGSKMKARRKERAGRKRFILVRVIRGSRRYLVVSRRAP